jgi:hypothetical protein
VKTMQRACSAGVLALALVCAGGANPVLAATEVVSGTGMLAAPTGLTPDDSVTAFPHAVLKNVKLNWAAVTGATDYRVQVGRDSSWSEKPILTKDVFFSEWTLPVGLPNATYVWRVAALKGSAVGHWSSESGQTDSEASFTKGWRTAPVPNTVTSPFVGEPTFSWSPVADASGYELQASKDPFFTAGSATGPTPDTSPSPTPQAQDGVTLAECFTGRTRYTPASDVIGASDTVGTCLFTDPDPGDTVYWRVRALDAYATGAVAGITTPQTESITDGSPSTDVAAIRPGVAGAWSSVSSFTYTPSVVAGGPLTTVSTTGLASEPDGLCTVTNAGATQAEHALCRDVPTLRWSDAGAVRYRITLSLDDAFTNVQYVIETPALQWTMPGALADSSAGGSWYYVVQACDATVCGPVTTTPPSFSKVTPRLTVGTAPSVAGEMTFQWQSFAAALSAATGQAQTQDAYAYHLQVATTSHPYYDQLVDEALVDETYFTPLKSYGDGDFLWRVQPVDNHGDALPWSSSQAFSRDATPPKVVSVTPSSAVAVTQPLKLVFSEAVTGVSSASVTLTPAATTTVTVTGPTTATLTPTKTLLPGATYGVVVSSAVHDLNGNVADPTGPTFTVSPKVNDASKALTYGGSWRVLASSSAIGGSYHSSIPTTTAKTSATMKFSGIGVSLQSCLGPGNGYLDVYLDGVKKARLSLYRSYTGCGVRVATLKGLARATHTLKVVGVGAHSSASRGNAVSVDYLTVLT